MLIKESCCICMIRRGGFERRGLGTGGCTGLGGLRRSLLSLHGESCCVMKWGLSSGSILPAEGHLCASVLSLSLTRML